MQKFYSRAVSVLLAVVMVCSLFTVLPITASAAETSGDVNENIKWSFDDSEGTLTLTGSGEMPDYNWSGANIAPWDSVRTKIKKAVIGKGITKLGAYSFYYCSNMTSVEVPDSLTTLGDNAINNCSALKYFEVPSTITKMGAFSNKKLYFSGDNYQITFTESFYGNNSYSTHCYCDPDSSVYKELNKRKSTTYPSYARFKGTLIAVKNDPVTITYTHTDDRVSSDMTEDIQKGYYTIPADIPTLTGAEFLGWTEYPGFEYMPTVYEPGEKVYFSDETTLYSVWKRRVEFYSGNSLVASKDVVFDEYISDSDLAEKPADSLYPAGTDFVGYYSDNNNSYFTYSDGSFSTYNSINKDCFTDGVFKLYAKYLAAPEFIGTTASLDGVIRLNFYIDTNGHSVSVTYRDLDIDTAHDNTDIEASRVTSADTGEIRKYSIPVNAKAIADEFEITVNYNGKQIQTTKSVKEYLEALAAKPERYAPDNPEKLLNLCYATLNYGAAAQKQFNHVGYIAAIDKTIPMANEKVPSTYIATAVPEDLEPDSGSQTDFSNLGLEYYASSLGLFSDTSYAICFEKIEDKDLTFYNNYNNQYIYSQNVGYVDYEVWKDFEWIGTDTHDLVAYSIDNIAAKDILKDIPVVVYYNNREYHYTFSPKTYIAKVLSNTGVNPTYEENEKTGNEAQFQSKANLENTVKAIYDYSTRAAEYWA